MLSEDRVIAHYCIVDDIFKSMHHYEDERVRVQVLTPAGISIAFCLVLGSENDSQSLQQLPFDVAPESCIYMDAGYTDYGSGDDLFEAEGIYARVQGKK